VEAAWTSEASVSCRGIARSRDSEQLHLKFYVKLSYGPYDMGFSSPGRGWELFTTTSRPELGPTQTPILWVPGALFMEVKRPGREGDHSPPSITEVKEWVELYLH